MPKVQIDGVGTVQLDDSFNTKSATDQQAIIDDIASQHGAQSQSASPQLPSVLDRVVASPIGRFAHDAIIAPMQNILAGPVNAGAAMGNAIPGEGHTIAGTTLANGGNIPMGNSIVDPAVLGLEGPYQDALARNRNTPGYALARKTADQAQAARGGSGFTGQVTAPFNPTLAGMVGLTGGLDTSNAQADAQTAAQDAYAQRHPLLSIGANMIGGMAAGPEGLAARLPVYASDLPVLSRLVKGSPIMGPLPQLPPRLPPDPAVAYVNRLATSAGKSPDAIAAFGAETAGKPFTGAEAIGRPGITGAAALARRGGVTGDALQGLLDERSAGAPGRVMADYASASGIDPAAAAGDMEAFVKSGRVKAQPIYDRAFSGGSIAPLEDQLRTSLTEITGRKGQIARQISTIEQNNSGALTARGAAGADIRAKYTDLHQQLQQAEGDRAAAMDVFRLAQADANGARPGAVWNPRIQQFLDDPIMKSGLGKGLEIQRLEALEKGVPFNAKEYAVTGTDADGTPIIGGVPNMRLLDAGKRGLDAIINESPKTPGGQLIMSERVKALIGVKKAYLKELDAVNPDYALARAQSGDYLSASEAFKRGQDTILNPNVTVADFSKAVERLSPADRMAKSGGAANKLFNLAQNGKLDPKLFNRPIVQQKLSVLLGPEKAGSLLRNIRAEADMAANTARMRPGNLSPTQELNAAMAEQDGGNDLMGLALDTGQNVARHGFWGGLGQTAFQKGAGGLAALRTRGMPVPVRDAAGALLQLPPPMLAAELRRLPTLPAGNGAARRFPYGTLLTLPKQNQ